MQTIYRGATFKVLDEDDPVLDIFSSSNIALTFKFNRPKGCSRWQPEDMNEYLNLYAKHNNYRLLKIMDRVPKGSYPYAYQNQEVFWDDYFDLKEEKI